MSVNITSDATITTDMTSILSVSDLIESGITVIGSSNHWFDNNSFYGNSDVKFVPFRVLNLVTNKQIVAYWAYTSVSKGGATIGITCTYKIGYGPTIPNGIGVFIDFNNSSVLNGTFSYQHGVSSVFENKYSNMVLPMISPLTGYTDYPIGSGAVENGIYAIPLTTDFTDGMTDAQKANAANYQIDMLPLNSPIPTDFNTIELWRNFSKRKNSTKRPSTSGESLTVRLIQDTSVLHPAFELKKDYLDYNYCKWGGRYYYITDVYSLTKDIIRIQCEVDYLATWKDDIVNSDLTVMYDTGSASDVVDPRLALKSTPTTQKATHVELRNDVYIEGSRGGTYLVTLTGEQEVGTYIVTESTLSYLLPDIRTAFDRFIQAATPYDAIKGGFKQLVGSGDVSSNIRDVRWVPFLYSQTMPGDTLVNPLKCGQYELFNDNQQTLGGTRLGKRISVKTSSIDIPWQFSDWRNGSKCTEIVLYIPFVGNISVSADDLKGQTSISVTTALDRVTGAIAFYVTSGDIVIGTYGANTGITIPIGGSQINPVSIGSSILAGIAAAASVGATAGLAATVASLGHTKPLDTCVGGIGSGAGAGLNTYIECITVCHDTVESPTASNSIHGTPSFRKKSLSTLTGYVQTDGAQVEMAGTDAEKDAVNSLLDSGIYIE